METKVIKNRSEIPIASDALRSGGFAAVPTETVYGLCVNGLDEKAVQALYEIKGRPEVKPLALMVPGAEAMDRYCKNIPEAARYLAEQFWPGPLTLVLPAKDCVPYIVRAGGETVGLRCPDHPLTLALLRDCGLPLAGPSANPSGQPSPKNAETVLGYFGGQIETVLDGGECRVGTESTLLDMSRTPYRVLRQGALSREAIAKALRKRMTVVGITGGSGCGKTTALRELEQMGALILDCDAVYHRLTESSDELREALCARFGNVYKDGKLDRKALGRIVFADEAALAELNTITHRFVDAECERLMEEHAMAGGTLAALDAVALIESGMDKKCCFTFGVLADREKRMARIMARDGITEEYAALRIDAQQKDEYYKESCTHLLYNNGTEEEFRESCRRLFRQLL
ncbi:MAG: threonylcarbamoyl-AMP synthase [Ruminococcaceae bacterium]|nr:threonylcarbamoyl-AMP synthase [Oscillospiraceae bacterium]